MTPMTDSQVDVYLLDCFSSQVLPDEQLKWGAQWQEIMELAEVGDAGMLEPAAAFVRRVRRHLRGES